MGAPLAMDWSLEQLLSCKRVFLDPRIAKDYNLPLYSLLTGEEKQHLEGAL